MADRSTCDDRTTHDDGGEHGGGTSGMSYWRFVAMIATSVLVMFGLKYLSTYQASHVSFSETRSYTTLLMGGAMAIVMLLFMLGLYRTTASTRPSSSAGCCSWPAPSSWSAARRPSGTGPT